jgi:hypothetical protein
MTRFVQSEDRIQGVLLPEYLDDYVAEDNPVPLPNPQSQLQQDCQLDRLGTAA